MADKKSFVLYCDYRKHFSLLSPEDQGRLIMAIFEYVETGTEPQLEAMPLMAFSFIRAQLDRDIDKYREICRKRKEAGSKGGRPPKANADGENQTEAKKPNGFSENQMHPRQEKDKDNNTPPTPSRGDERFKAFWKAYPRKTGKGAAEKA
ncbi:MAG: hypothetical protein IKZ00_02830, partial [Bacteroidaceae bacterium]|nr:hypothetical protein [Bacteroidaceae bacterium]